ncbi:LuxR C-terminal-related transcriptional regulator [Streptomyces violaceusniger]|uniref:LuxR C-terminal-related transcriptional regulator n=1 Tax=Streptomyces violaceusniger TaxID=68280 RepID=UPI0031DAE775
MERERELGVLGELARRTAAGHPGFAVIQGPDGIGKTALLHSHAADSRSLGLRVLETRAVGQPHPLGTVGALWKAMTSDVDSPPPSWRPMPADALRSRETLRGLLADWHEAVRAAAVRGPLLITVDDAHEADPESLRFLAHTTRGPAESPVLLVLARRIGSEWTALDEVMAQPPWLVVRPRPLTRSGIGRVARQLTGADGDARFQEDCLAATNGNPLLVTGLVTALREHGLALTGTSLDSASDHDLPAFRVRVARLLHRQPVLTIQTARAMAVLDGGADNEVCARLARADTTTFVRSQHALDCLGLVRSSPGADAWSFTHLAVRNAVLADMSAEHRAAMHGRAARLLYDSGAPAAQIAEHLLRSGVAADQPWARAVLREAARKETLQGSVSHAVRLLRPCAPEGAEDTWDPALVAELGIAESTVDTAASIRHLTSVWDRVSRPDLRLAALGALVGGLTRTGQVGRAVALLHQHRSATSGLGQVTASAQLLEAQLLMAATDNRDAYTELLRTAPLGLDLSGHTPGERALLAWRAVISVARMDRVPESLRAADTVLRRGTPTTDSPTSMATAASALMYADRPHEAEYVYRQLIDGTDTMFDQAYASLLALSAEAYERLGALDQALRSSAKALRKTRTARYTRHDALPLAVRLHVFLDQGDLAAATALASEIPDAGIDDAWQWNELLCARGRLRLARNEPEAALRDLVECGRRQRAWQRTNPAVSFWWYWAGQAHLSMGDRIAAVELGEWAVDLARPAGFLSTLGTGLELLAEAGCERDRPVLLEEAETVLTQTRAALVLARVRVARGRALQQAGHTEAARAVLRQGWEDTYALGARSLHATAHQSLVAAGARPRRAGSRRAGALTRSEQQVARLAAEGRSNAEIAESLFVTRRTVEAHLTSVYRKLGLSGRRELRGAMADRGKGITPARQETW